ncbi:MAG: flavin oxidoreductase, partial [Clostridia bacterium]|nr:flavin oxidoreductase [Clostridia bacterium]
LRQNVHDLAQHPQAVGLILEFQHPLTMECRVLEFQDQPYGLRVLGEIVNVLAEERVLDEKGKVDAKKLGAFVFDPFGNGYYAVGEKAGQAWHSGAHLMKK